MLRACDADSACSLSLHDHRPDGSWTTCAVSSCSPCGLCTTPVVVFDRFIELKTLTTTLTFQRRHTRQRTRQRNPLALLVVSTRMPQIKARVA
ncbi:hypothetical protein CPB83DRAFT_161606 [Crepidotus variabilis]|uniref:Uncharacterized protein n=1 Tax=Crepidotus variabilis TaxID=179855 RepID=A0A9P6EL26_9AGAR|nr:hypothetical protein CPB83DRAFT_161606 [Crepidotus variabilis]